MDDSDVPTLDVGDFEILDECASDEELDQKSEYDYEYDEHDIEDNNDEGTESIEHIHIENDDGDNNDTVLDVSIDVSENEFLETVDKDFSENIEDQAKEESKNDKIETNNVESKQRPANTADDDELEVIAVVPKKPGPKSKTMNLQPASKKSGITINFLNKDDSNKKKDNCEETSKNESNKISNNGGENCQAISETQENGPKKFTDEEIMRTCDEIENAALKANTFFIEGETAEIKEIPKDDEIVEVENKTNDENSMENTDEQKNQQQEEEDWDKCEVNLPKKPKIKIEDRQFKESEMWYKDKLKLKEDNVEEKFTKLAKIIQYSYPLYKRWLDRNESLFGTAICKVESSRYIPLDKLRPNRWKFVCNKKLSQQSTKEEDKQADNASDNKDILPSWVIHPGIANAKVEDTEEFPTFVMRVVKVFEEFLNLLEKEDSNIEEIKNEAECTNQEKDDDENAVKKETAEVNEKEIEIKQEDDIDDISKDENKFAIKNVEGLTLMIRCNQKNDLMLNITGKNLKQKFLNKVKEFFETGNGSDCNVKSLICKVLTKEDKIIQTKSNILLGNQYLEDNVGSVKVHLSPQMNIWSNLSGIEVLADVVAEFLLPTKKTTVLEIGCGTGVMSLLLAAKCQKIIGLDIHKEIKEAEALAKLNGVTNATFVTGKPKAVMNQINKTLINSKAVAVINTNNVFGRSIDVIGSLRKMAMLGRIVIITTLTKQAITSILELTQPADDSHGNPFIPIRACIVDTTPRSFGFDIVMSMERRTMRNLLKASAVTGGNKNSVGLVSKSKQEAALKLSSGSSAIPPFAKNQPTKFVKNIFKTKAGIIGKDTDLPASKRLLPNESEPASKKFKSLGQDLRINPVVEKKLRDPEGDLRNRLSKNRVELAHEMHEQRKLLDTAKSKLSGSVDVNTVKKLQEMLDLAIKKTNKLQKQLPPRSVWDRIAPAEDEAKNKIGPNMFSSNVPPESKNVPKSLKMKQSVTQKPNIAPYQKPQPGRFQGGLLQKPDIHETPVSGWNRKPNEAPRPTGWGRVNSGGMHALSPPRRPLSPPRRMLSPPRRPLSPPRRPLSPPRRLLSPPRRPLSPPRRPLSPPRRPLSPPRRPLSPPRRPLSPPRRPLSPPRRPLSPPQKRRMLSPPRRPLSPPRRPLSPMRRPLSPPRRPVSPGFRGNRGPPMRQTSPPRRQHASPPRRAPSPHYRPASPPRPNRQKSPPRRYADEWDIPSRGSIDNNWPPARSEKEKSSWQPTPPTNWDQSNRFRPEQNSHQSFEPPGSNWDIQKKDSLLLRESMRHEVRLELPRLEPRHEQHRHEPLRHEPLRLDPPRPDMSRHEQSRLELPRLDLPRLELPRLEAPRLEPPRHEPSRHEPPRLEQPRIESRWDSSDKQFRAQEKDTAWDDLPEDARDPWGDDPLPQPSKETRPSWGTSSQINQQPSWLRDKPSNDNWSNKSTFPIGGPSSGSNNSAMNMPTTSLGMNMNNMNNMSSMSNMNNLNNMNNMNSLMWQQGPSQTSTQNQQSNRNTSWLPPGNWHGASGPIGNISSGNISGNSMVPPNPMNHWQAQTQSQQQNQQSFADFSARLFNPSNPFINNRR